MICNKCHGKGQRILTAYRRMVPEYSWLPCPDCEGRGIINCCEGLKECPEPDQGETACGLPESEGEA